MFDIAWTEMLVIAIVLIVVVGPKELPGMLRTFGKTTAKLRVMAGDFRKQFDEALKEADLGDLKTLADDARKLNPANELKKAFNPLEAATKDVRAGLEAAFNPPPQPKADTPAAPAVTQAPEPAAPAAAAPVVAAAAAKPVRKAPAKPAASKSAEAKPVAKPAEAKPAAKAAAATPATKPAETKPAAKAAEAKPAAAKPAAAKPAAKAASRPAATTKKKTGGAAS